MEEQARFCAVGYSYGHTVVKRFACGANPIHYRFDVNSIT